MAADAQALDDIPEFIRDVFYPSPLPSFRESMPSGDIEILLQRGKGQEPTRIRLINMFPFMTLKDIKIALYIELKREAIAIPEYVYLCMNGSEPGKRYLGGATAPVDFSWNLPTVSAKDPFRIMDPFNLVTGEQLDLRFVDSGGDRKLVAPVDRERMTIEDAFLKKGGIGKGIPTLVAYLYSDLLGAIPGAKPPSANDWNGRLYPMFPHLSVTSSADDPTGQQKADADRFALAFVRRQQFLVRIESILERNVPLVGLTLAGVKYLQLVWDTKKNIQGIETQFYDAAVTDRRPFMRLIPTEGSGISKVFMKDGKTPDIQDPKLLTQWSQERSPTPEQDFAFAKIMLRRGLPTLAPIYATMRLFNDGTADCVVEPPKGIKKLEPRNDLESFGEHLVEGLQDLPYISTMPDLGRGTFVLGVRVPKGSEAIITPKILRERLPVFSAMFQEITPLPGEKPMVALRFKLVSNFAREDRIQTFLTQVIQRKVLRGEGGIRDLVSLVADEFQIGYDEARKQVSSKLQNQGEVTLIVPETREYMRQNNTGIDVSIFAQHPFYTFHLSNVNSLDNLRRIVTALSILMSVNSDELEVGAKAVKELITAEAYVPPQPKEEEEEDDDEAKPELEEEKEVTSALPIETEDAEDVGGADEMPDYLDFFAYDQEKPEMTLEQAHAEEEAAAAARIEGEARPEPPLGSATRSPTTTAAAAGALRKELAQTVVSPKEELEGMPEAKKVQAEAQAEAKVPARAQEEEDLAAGETGVAHFFLSKLQEADSRLFEYRKTNPSLKRYVSQCQPTYGRQPAVLSEEKFQEMKDEYAKDNVQFQIYPLAPGDPDKLPGLVERDYFTVLKYGSSPQTQNYYICSRYFCARDEILVREVDLQSTVMRRPIRRSDGTVDATKKPGECPFCKGRVIRNQRAPGPGETILERVVKPPTQNLRHLYIGFIKKTPHPEGFYLPCCFGEELPIRFKDNPAFDKYKEWGMSPKANVRPVSAAAAAILQDDDEVAAPRITDTRAILDYATTLNQVAKKYIIGAEKLPLDIGTLAAGTRGEAQIGLLPTVLNAYFDQEPTQLVSRAFNPQKIKPDGMGFLRIGVDNRNRYQNDSFLAAIAPFYLKNTAGQMKELILESVQPREFLALNYGNLAIEFYDPGDATIKRPSPEDLRLWASKYLQVDTQQENEEAVMRAYMSYMAFQDWLLAEDTKKEYRQFAQLFAQSPIMRKSSGVGITFIVLDILKTGKMNVRCPPYGFNSGTMNKNDVAFVLHHWSGIWEPIFYVDNRSHEIRDEIYTLIFQYAGKASWPQIVTQRLGEFMAQCNSSGRAIYASHANIHSLAMIPASFARTVLEKDPSIVFDGVLRDAYNHIGALVFRERADATGRHIILPVVDDGEILIGKNLYMDWDDPALKPAPIDQLLRFYKKYVETRFAYYPGFSPVYVVKSEQSGSIEAVQLRNGLYVPVTPPASEEVAKQLEGSPTRMVTEMEWSKNHEICLEEKEGGLPGEKDRMSVVDFQEIFEHLRLTFSNWLAAKEDGGDYRGSLERVIFSHRLPLFEKRKRLEILLGREVEKWITTDFADEDAVKRAEFSLLRVDCRVRGQESCNGRCVWKQRSTKVLEGEDEEEDEEDSGKCLLHVPKETQLGEDERRVSAPRVLLLRLIEELLRYGERRRQLLEKDVSRLASLEKPITITTPGKTGKQVIFPEKSAAWYELLRLEWAVKPDEQPRFLEEMGREPKAAQTALASQDESTMLPEELVTILNGEEGADPKTGAIRLLRAPFESLMTPLRITGAEAGLTPDMDILDESMLRKIVRKTGGSVLQIDLRADPPAFTGAKPIRPAYEGVPVPVVVITESGPGLLVLNPAAPQILKRADMPVGLLTTLDSVLATKKGVIGMEVKAPQQPGKTLADLRAQASQRQPSVQPPPSQPADEQ